MAIVFIGYVYVWRPRLILNAAAAGAVGLVAMRAAAPGLLGTLRALFEYLDQDPSISGRTNDYEEAFEIVRNNIWLGRGPGTFNVQEYILLDNQWLNLLITNGVIGTMLFAALLLTGVAQAHRLARRAHTDEMRHLGQALLLLIWVYAISSFFFDSLGYPQLRTITFLALGCIGALWIMQSNDTQPQVMPNRRQVLRSGRSVFGRSGAPDGGKRIAIAPPPGESDGLL
jgi:O-antigen ligase